MLYFFTFFTCVIQGVYGQDIREVLSDAQVYHDARPQEKLYLHLDRPSYTAGETIWIKAYCTVGVENLLSNLSGIAYIELVGPAQQVVSRIKIPLVMGLGVADIVLQDTITEGTYRLRAYTNWMRNSDPVFFYDRTIPISNGRSDGVLTSTEISPASGGQTYTVRLTELNGSAIGDVPVSFEILQEGRVSDRMRGRSDKDGKVRLVLEDRHLCAKVRYRFEMGEGRKIEKVFRAVDPLAQPSVQLELQ